MSRGRATRVLSLVGVLALGLGAGWWAGRAALVSPSDDQGVSQPVTAEVVEASVGQTATMGAAAVQTFEQVASNGLAGVVTWVGSGEVDVGEAIYSVGSTSARAVEGQVPFWRGLGAGDRGEDVRQLQGALADLGYLSGEVDGVFGSGTTTALRAWQRAIGAPTTGIVALGELVAVPSLPDAVRLGDDIVLGSVLGGGESAVFARIGEPAFEMVLTPEQAERVPDGAAISLSLGEATWAALASGTTVDELGQTVVHLISPGGGPVCASECSLVPPDARTPLRAVVEVVPDVTGPSVPIAAIETDPSGQPHVTLADGTLTPVEIVGTQGGVAVVSGVEVGAVVLLPGAAPTPAPS